MLTFMEVSAAEVVCLPHRHLKHSWFKVMAFCNDVPEDIEVTLWWERDSTMQRMEKHYKLWKFLSAP